MVEKLNDIIDTVEQSNTLKTHFAANISENIQNVKVFTVRGEASLMIDDMDGLKKNYAQVQQENTALTRGELMPKNSSYFKRDDGIMSMKVRELED